MASTSKCQVQAETSQEHYKFVLVGGGIAGVTAAETLATFSSEEKILLLTASPIVKAVTNFKRITKTLEEFDVVEKPLYDFKASCPNVEVVRATVSRLDAEHKVVYTSCGRKFTYEKLCICSGGTPKVIANDNPHVLGIRDTESVKVFQQRLASARRIVVIGNGGIATELVYEIEGCQIIWAVKDDSITHTFVDSGASAFFLQSLDKDKDTKQPTVKRLKYTAADDVAALAPGTSGSALGPDWSSGLHMRGQESLSRRVHIEYKVEVAALLTPEEVCRMTLDNPFCDEGEGKSDGGDAGTSGGSWPVYVKLTNDKVFGCDFVISATGVIPNIQPFLEGNQFEVSSDGGFVVNNKMQTSVPSVYAAGDVCTAGWDPAPHWIQMRLWSQARQMGSYAAKSMVADINGEDIFMDFCFELFAHATRFFNFKVVLLGKFNAQGLGKNYELLARVTKGVEYVKVVLSEGRMEGCVLIGETDLEETFENLILNKMDLSMYGEDLLDPGIDIEDYFD